MQVSRFILVSIVSLIVGFTSTVSIPVTKEHVVVQTKHVLEKDNLLLVCNTTEQPDIDQFYWVRNDTIKGSSTFYQSGWNLEFIDIRRAASGVYACHAIRKNTEENVTLVAFKVDVQYPTEIENMFLSPQVINVNETFSVGCSLHGNPEPVWSVRNNDTGESPFSATISGDVTIGPITVRCGDSGMWVCTGLNRLNKGINVTRGYHLTVNCPPQPDPKYYPIYEYKASLGSNISMALNISADPAPGYKWARTDGRLFGNVLIDNSARGTILTVYGVGVKDFGNYSLETINGLGSFTKHFHLKAYGYPGKPHNLRTSQISENSVDLDWTSGFDSGTQQRFQIMKLKGNTFESISPMISGQYEDDGVGQEWSYHLDGLKSGTQYNLSIMAQNAENMTFSDPIVFYTTKPQFERILSHWPKVVVGCFVLAVLLAIAVIVPFAYKRSRAPQNEDKKKLARDLKTEYGGTIAINGDAGKQQNFSKPAKF